MQNTIDKGIAKHEPRKWEKISISGLFFALFSWTAPSNFSNSVLEKSLIPQIRHQNVKVKVSNVLLQLQTFDMSASLLIVSLRKLATEFDR